MELKKRLSGGIENLKLFWKRPPLGRYMTFKEIASLSVGGMGVQFVVYCVQNMILCVGNTLIGNTIGISPKPLYAIYLISVIASFPLTALRAKLIDGTRSKKGKYRPFILSMGIPTVILSVAFIWMPYERMTLLWKCVTVLLFNIGLQFFYNFFSDANASILNVLSPNTIERSDVYSIKSVTDSFAPTLGNIFMPLLARLITGKNTLFDLRIYRFIYPPIILVGFVMAMLIYINTEEKIVQAKTHIVHMKFVDAIRAVAKNKYFWIISLAGWLGFLEGSFNNILGWLYNYQAACSAGQYALITSIIGNASLWPMLFAPFIIRAVGKRNMLVFANLFNIVFILMMYPLVRYGDPKHIIWLLLVCLFVNSMATMLGHILGPSINGDIRDYQHYITGERIDGMFVAVGLIGSVVTLLTSFVLPTIYEEAGLNETVARSLGYDGSNVYNVLYDPGYFKSICGILVLASAVGAALNVIPFFFYDLSETRQRAMVTVLKIRALFEDYGNDALSDEALVEAIDLIEESQTYNGCEPVALSRDGVKAAKKSKDRATVKAAKAAYKADRLYNEKIEISRYVVREITRFDTSEVKADVTRAQEITAAGLSALPAVTTVTLAAAKAMPKATKEEKALRSAAIDRARAELDSKKVIAKYYPNGLQAFDMSVFDALFKAEDDTEAALKTAYAALLKANSGKDRRNAKKIRSELNCLRSQKAQIRRDIKKATREHSIFNRAAKPYLDAKKLLIQQTNYGCYEEIKAGYEASKQRAESERAARLLREAREKEEKEAYAAKLSEERKAAKAKKR